VVTRIPIGSSRLAMLLLGGSLAAGLIVSTYLATRGLDRLRPLAQTISVKGYAEKQITSDLAVWTGSLAVSDLEMPTAYAKLEKARAETLAYLAERGAAAEAVDLGPIHIANVMKKTKEGVATNELDYYTLRQTVGFSTTKIDQAARVAREAGALIQKGVPLQAEAPQYLYTKLNDLKTDMLAQATGNAKLRADQLASHSGARVGKLRSAKQGVFQITPAHATEVSDQGENDTTSIAKTVRAVVTMEFAIE
jgi:uncharacterized protein